MLLQDTLREGLERTLVMNWLVKPIAWPAVMYREGQGRRANLKIHVIPTQILDDIGGKDTPRMETCPAGYDA